jgi:UDP-glucose 4-epimerase
MMTKILVTGGTGFIGSAVSQELIGQGFEVRSYDVEPSKLPNVESYIGSIMDEYNLTMALEGCEYVVHLAAMLGVKRTEIQRLGCMQINIQGTKNVLDASVKCGIKKVVFSSSSEVYGEPAKVPISETDPKQPISIYAVTKLAGEEYLRAYFQQYGLNYSVVRFFNVYGPGQVAEFVMPRFIKQVQLGLPPRVYGEGRQTRAFCHVNDAARGIRLALLNEEANGQDFNIGNPEAAVSMMDLAHLIIEASGKVLTPEVIPMENSDRVASRDIQNRAPDISKAKLVLGYQPTVNLKQGINNILSEQFAESWFEPLI